MGPQCYVCYTLMGLADNKFARPSQSGGGGGGLMSSCSLK